MSQSSDPEFSHNNARQIILCLVSGIFIGGMGDGVAFPTLPQLGPILGISPFIVGLILSMNRMSRMVVNTPVGHFIDRVGVRRPLILGYFLQGIGSLGYAFAMLFTGINSASVFLLARAMWGFGSAFVYTGTFSAVTNIAPKQIRSRWIGYTRGAMSLGYPAGLVIGGLVADLVSITAAFLVSALGGLVACVVVFFVMPDIDPDVDAQDGGLRDSLLILQTDVRVVSICLVNFLARFIFGGILLATAVLFAADRGITVRALSETGVGGVILAVSVFTIALVTLVVGRVNENFTNRSAVAIPSLLIYAAGFVYLALASNLTDTLIAVMLIGVGHGGTTPSLLTYLSDLSRGDDAGKLSGVYNTFGDLGGTLGPIVALPLATYIGFTGEYIVCAVALLLASVLVVVTLYNIDGDEIEPVRQAS